ncbi:Chloroplast envelope membrane protein [Nymphaea thermarum]|nr:Chloroplast envelope membrane protein [Nymphaea thermarum]
MSNSIIFCGKFILAHQIEYRRYCLSPVASTLTFRNSRRRRFGGMIRSAKNGKPDKRTWWQKFFLDNDDWFGLKDDILDDKEESDGGIEEELSEDKKFRAWTTRAEVIMELREAQEDMLNAEGREWEDWLQDDSGNATASKKGQGWEDGLDADGVDASSLPSRLSPQKDVVGSVRELLLGKDVEDEILYEDRVFRYASGASAKFLAILVIIPWALDFVVHDYILMPFLDRYVKTVPLAAELLDVRKSQKLEMIKTLKVEKARYRFESEIGKSPPLSDDELWWELRHKALELRDEYRIENRKACANIWSDMVFGLGVFFILYFNQSKVTLMKFTGYKILRNISDTGKAFLIILITDIFLGYHSESGWQTLIEIIFEHYGLEVDQAAITIFVSFVPVVIDACVKLWLFKFLPRFSPNVANIFREMKRH